MNKYVVTRVDGKPIPEDEPIFVIRGQDQLAGEMVRHYIKRYQLCADATEETIDEVANQLHELMLRMDAWPKKKWAD